MAKARRIMEEFQMDEISAVDMPAQKGAQMAIMKRDDSKGESFTKIVETFEKKFIDPADGAVSFMSAYNECARSDRYWESMKDISPMISSLDTSLRSIAGDATLNSEGRLTMMKSSIEDFLSAVRDKYPTMAPQLEVAVGKKLDELTDPICKTVQDLSDRIQLMTLKVRVKELQAKFDKAGKGNPYHKPKGPDGGQFTSGSGGGGKDDSGFELPTKIGVWHAYNVTIPDREDIQVVKIKRQEDGSYYGDSGEFDFQGGKDAIIRRLKKWKARIAGLETVKSFFKAGKGNPYHKPKGPGGGQFTGPGGGSGGPHINQYDQDEAGQAAAQEDAARMVSAKERSDDKSALRAFTAQARAANASNVGVDFKVRSAWAAAPKKMIANQNTSGPITDEKLMVGPWTQPPTAGREGTLNLTMKQVQSKLGFKPNLQRGTTFGIRAGKSVWRKAYIWQHKDSKVLSTSGSHDLLRSLFGDSYSPDHVGRSSAHKASVDRLKVYGKAGKGNPYHKPKGPGGGQFTSGSGGGSDKGEVKFVSNKSGYSPADYYDRKYWVNTGVLKSDGTFYVRGWKAGSLTSNSDGSWYAEVRAQYRKDAMSVGDKFKTKDAAVRWLMKEGPNQFRVMHADVRGH